jgi:hypothetical protein
MTEHEGAEVRPCVAAIRIRRLNFTHDWILWDENGRVIFDERYVHGHGHGIGSMRLTNRLR